MSKGALLLTIVSIGSLPGAANAQLAASVRSGVVSPPTAEPGDRDKAPSLFVASLASAVVPGSGQALLHSRRALAYGAAEAMGWIAYSVQARDGDRLRRRYRDLSRTIARAAFTPDGPSGNWDYFERIEKFAASGAYDAIPGGALDPEIDVATYNGSIWLLARQTFWRDPNSSPAVTSSEYQSAIAFYVRRAVPSELRWSWTGSPEGFQEYRRAIAASNNAFKRSEQTVGLVIANHILSAVDAYVSVRLRASRASDGRTLLSAALPFGGGH